MGHQALALRRRWLISSFENKIYEGCYWGIATRSRITPSTDPATWVLAKLREVRTDLNVFTQGEQVVLMNHG
jgi:hypothetical protein